MSLKCPKCGSLMKTPRCNKGINGHSRSLSDEAMGTYTRLRQCTRCDHESRTVEIDSGELSELRRRAYLYHLSEVRS